MKILFVTDGISPFVLGGMQKHSAVLVKYIISQKIDVTLIHCVPYGQDLPTDIEVNAALQLKEEISEVHSLTFPKSGKLPGHYIRNSYKYSVEAFRLMKDSLADFDLIYTQGFTGWKFIDEKRKGMKLPPISINFHGLNMFQKTPDIRTYLQYFLFFRRPVKRLHQHADIVFSFGGKLMDISEKLVGKNTKIIEQKIGIDNEWLDEAEISSTGSRKFVFVGRYERLKGVEELSTVIKSLKLKDKIEFEFIGPIPKEKQIVQAGVKYHGELKDVNTIKQILKQADVLVCPSFSEGMPTVILEAMACGCLIIATNVGAVEVLVDEEVGFLINAGNIKELEEKIVLCSEMSVDELNRIKRNSRLKVKNQYTVDTVMKDWIFQLKEGIN